MSMDYEIGFADSTAKQQAVYRLWYRVYWLEMKRYGKYVNHENKQLITDDVMSYRTIAAFEKDGEAIGSIRVLLGQEALFSPDIEKKYDIARFTDFVSRDKMVLCSRLMVERPHRGTLLPLMLLLALRDYAMQQNAELAFLECEPHMLNLYNRLGFRSYKKGYTSPDFGYMIPLVLVWEDIDHLKSIRSPILMKLDLENRHSTERSRNLSSMLGASAEVVSEQLAETEEWRQIFQIVEQVSSGTISLFTDLSEEETAICLKRSHMITCSCGDRIISHGQEYSSTIFVVLSGVVEVYKGDHLVAMLAKGSVFGEIGFLTKVPRTANVVAATDDVHILALNDSTLTGVMESNPRVGVKLALNLAKILCARLVADNK